MKLFYGLLLSVLVLAGHVNAKNNFPATYQVSDINLNLRTGPSTRFASIDNIPARTQVTVVGFNDRETWAQVEWDGKSGWVSASYIKFIEMVEPVETATSAINLTSTEGMLLAEPNVMCGGTEPFWNVAIMSQAELTYTTPDGEPITTFIESIETSVNSPNSQMFSAIGFTGIVNRQQCSDGMSDTQYGWSIDLVVNNGFGPKLYSGCCSVVAN